MSRPSQGRSRLRSPWGALAIVAALLLALAWGILSPAAPIGRKAVGLGLAGLLSAFVSGVLFAAAWPSLRHARSPAFSTSHERPAGVPAAAEPVRLEADSELTAQMTADPELRRSERRFRELAAALPQGIFESDSTGMLVYANACARQMFGLGPEELDGKFHMLDMIVPAERERAAPRIEQLRTGFVDPTTPRQYLALRPDGTVFPVLIYATPVTRDDSTTGLLGTIVDISERVATEEAVRQAKEAAEAANRAKSEFLANISHEIRTPLNAVLGLTELVLSADLRSEEREHLTLALQSGEVLLRLINDLLDFSKIEAGRLELDCGIFDPHRLLAETIPPFRMMVKDRPLQIRLQVGEAVPHAVHGDAARLRQVLVNLIGNSIKFTSEGEISVQVGVAEENADHVILAFSVRDTGIGIPADKLERIFHPFEQADNSTTRRYGGTGLGLAIARRLVGLMGGELEVESEPGRGSTFRFRVRLSRREALRAA